ncbi:MAG: hypothetical protein D6819_10680 [Gammaproteobacteria bacterium]|nr:MAG: hypothetical protein D6819_10680 [Gammaproteobacteria bacterium]
MPRKDATKTAVRAAFLQAYERLDKAVGELMRGVSDDDGRPAWICGACDDREARRMACGAFASFYYEDEQEPGMLDRTLGAVGASQETIRLAKAVNDAKENLREAHKRLARSHATRRRVLASLGMGRFHPIQACRRIHVLDVAPVRVGFTWAFVTSRTLVTADKVKKMVMNDPEAKRYLDRVEALPDDEVLIIRRQLIPRPQANLAFKTPGGFARHTITTTLPILYPAALGDDPPIISPPPEPVMEPRPPHRRRMDSAVEWDPVVPPLDVYRLREPRRLDG